MLNDIREWLRVRKLKRDMIKQFYQEHGDRLPRYDPKTGIPIYWHVYVQWNGDYDIYTGKPRNGRYTLVVKPYLNSIRASSLCEYEYDIENKVLITDKNKGYILGREPWITY